MTLPGDTMTSAVATKRETTLGLAPFSLKDAPCFIESQFPVGRLSAEAYKERKAGAGQTLTSLGSYWKGRKPLVLVRACILASLLPVSDDPESGLEMFEALMAMDHQGLSRRSPNVSPEIITKSAAVPRQKWEPHIAISSAGLEETVDNAVSDAEAEAEPEEGRRSSPKAKWRRIDLSSIDDAAERRAERARIE